MKISERLGFEPRDPFYQVNRLAGDCIRPLCHLSNIKLNYLDIVVLVIFDLLWSLEIIHAYEHHFL